MKKQDYVFDLISSLTRGEKRNFRMLTQITSGSKKYLKLFDCMDSMDSYDESKILKKFRADPSFEKQFAYNKNYLYNAILNALAYFHKGPNSEVSSLTLQVEILMQKNLYDQAKKQLRKVKERVMAQEKFEDLLKLFRFEVEILRLTENYKILHESLRQVEFEEKVTLEKISNLLKMRHLSVRVEVLMATIGMARREDDLEIINEIMASPEMEDEKRALSNRAKIMYNVVLRKVYHFKDDHISAFPHIKRVLNLYEANPILIEDDRIGYLKMLGSHVHTSFLIYGLDEAVKGLDKVMAFKPATPQENVFRFSRIYLYLLAMHSDQGVLASEEFMEDFHNELEKLSAVIPPKTELYAYFMLMTYYHTHGDHSRALKANNEFLNKPRPAMSISTQGAARIYNLVLHFELENYDLIEYNLKSTSRFIYKIGRMFKYERRILRFFTKVINLKNQEEVRQELQQLKADLLVIFEDPYEKKATITFKVIEWIDSKLEGIPFAQTMERSKLAHIKEQNQSQAVESDKLLQDK
jgi:tetratricopeptide (TPR) repeat protein